VEGGGQIVYGYVWKPDDTAGRLKAPTVANWKPVCKWTKECLIPLSIDLALKRGVGKAFKKTPARNQAT